MNDFAKIFPLLVVCVASLGCGSDDQNATQDQTQKPTGTEPLVNSSSEPAGANCPHGGQKIAVGIDKNANGTLDDDEVSTTTYACNGAPGADGGVGAMGSAGQNGATGEAGAPGPKGESGDAGSKGDPGEPGQGSAGDAGTPGLSSLVRTGHELAGPNCIYGGVRIESGLDADASGTLDDGEVNAAQTQFVCQASPAYPEIGRLPAVATVRSFALAASADDGSAHLGFMFTDPTYQQTLLNAGAITNIGGSYSGPNTYVTYRIANAQWQGYEGRETPQTYSFSELVVADNASYYTTSYPSFGGLISTIQNGGKGTYALTPAFTTERAHSVAVPKGSDTLYALIAQKTAGLTFSSFPLADFGQLSNFWTNLAVLDTAPGTVSQPELVVAGTAMVASYVQGPSEVVRATASPATVAQESDMPIIGGCDDAVLSDIAWDGTNLYVACEDSTNTLTVERASLADLANVTFEPVATSITGAISALDLEASATGVSLAIRQGMAIRIYANLADPLPSFDAALPGNFDLARTTEGLMLAVCDFAGDRTLRTFLSR